MSQGFKGPAAPRGTCPHNTTRLLSIDYTGGAGETQCVACGALFAFKAPPRRQDAGFYSDRTPAGSTPQST